MVSCLAKKNKKTKKKKTFVKQPPTANFIFNVITASFFNFSNKHIFFCSFTILISDKSYLQQI